MLDSQVNVVIGLLQAILNTHPYHVDSLLQLSEICKMGEDYQMAAELIGQLTFRLYLSSCSINPHHGLITVNAFCF